MRGRSCRSCQPSQGRGDEDCEAKPIIHPSMDRGGVPAARRRGHLPVTLAVAFVDRDHAVQDVPDRMVGNEQLGREVEARDPPSGQPWPGEEPGESARAGKRNGAPARYAERWS